MRIYTYFFIVIGLMGLLYIAGIDTFSSGIIATFDFINHPENLKSTTFYGLIAGIFALTGVGMYLGYIFRVNPESFIVAGFVGTLLIFFADIISIIVYYRANYADQLWMGLIITLCLFPIAFGYLLSLIGFWRGISD